MRWRDYTRACGESASYDEPVDVCAIERRLRISGLLKMAPESVVAPSMGVCTGMTSKTAPSLRGRTRPRTGTGACPYGSLSVWFQPPNHEIRTFSSGIPLGMPDPGKGELLKTPPRPEEFLAPCPEFTPHFRAFAVIAPHRGAAESPPRSEEETFSWTRGVRKRESGDRPLTREDRPAPFGRQSFSRRSGPLFRARGPAAENAPGISIKYRTIR